MGVERPPWRGVWETPGFDQGKVMFKRNRIVDYTNNDVEKTNISRTVAFEPVNNCS